MNMNQSEIENMEKQMMRDVFVEKAWMIIRQNLKGKVLDLGCGSGLVTYKYTDVVGLDIQKIKTIIPFVLGDAHNIPFKNESFDTILMSHVLEHFPDSDPVLKECSRVLKREGKLILSVPNVNTFSAKVFGKKYGYVFRTEHQQYFDAQKLRNKLTRFDVGEIFGTTATFPYADYIGNMGPFRKLWWKLGDWINPRTRDLVVIAYKP